MKRCLSFFLACVAIFLVSTAHAAERPPNILILLADDLGYSELGCQGSRDIPTPNIDSLARHGIRFTNGYVSAPVCCPSRAGIMTGRYQTRFGHELNAIGAENLKPGIGLPLTETTLARRMKAAGYATGMFGKWHLGGSAPFHPQQRGFDEFFGFLHEGHFYVPPPYTGVTSFLRTNALPEGLGPRWTDGRIIWTAHMGHSEPPYDESNPLLRGTTPVAEKEYLTDALTREAVAFIERHRSEPFFLYLPYNAVHSPMQAPPKYLNRFPNIPDLQRRVFGGMLSALDDSVGAVLHKLRTLKLEENTLVFFLSDNGGPTVELTSSNAPLRGGKGQLWEGGIRIPFLMQWKGHLPAGRVYDQPVISLDIFPTALAAAGAFGVTPSGGSKGPAEAGTPNLDGVNLLPHLTGKAQGAPHETLFWRYGGSLALREGNWKLVRQPERGTGSPKFQLFDLANDIAETTDLALQHPEVAKRLHAALDQLNGQMVEPLWGRRAPASKSKR